VSKLYAASQYQDKVVDFSDSAFQVLAAQISANYLQFIKMRVIPELDEFSHTSLRELRTLMAIARIDGPVKGTQIVKTLSYDPASVTRSTKWLIENGLISKKEDPEDARSTLYVMSQKGIRLSELYTRVSWRALRELNEAGFYQPNHQDVLQALSVLEQLRERSQFAAKLAADYKLANMRDENA